MSNSPSKSAKNRIVIDCLKDVRDKEHALILDVKQGSATFILKYLQMLGIESKYILIATGDDKGVVTDNTSVILCTHKYVAHFEATILNKMVKAKNSSSNSQNSTSNVPLRTPIISHWNITDKELAEACSQIISETESLSPYSNVDFTHWIKCIRKSLKKYQNEYAILKFLKQYADKERSEPKIENFIRYLKENKYDTRWINYDMIDDLSTVADSLFSIKHEKLQSHKKAQSIVDDIKNALETRKEELLASFKTTQKSLLEKRNPIYSCVISGSAGIGKTQFARLLSKAIDGSDEARIVDCSSLSENAVAMLLGSPQGYVGYSNDSQLFKWYKERPHGVIIFDEFDRGGKKLQELMLSVLDGSTLKDSKDNTMDMGDFIFIFLTNLGSVNNGPVTDMDENALLQFLVKSPSVDPAFLSRINRKIYFNRYYEDEAPLIFSLIIRNSLLLPQQWVELSNEARQYIKNRFSGNIGIIGARDINNVLLGQSAALRGICQEAKEKMDTVDGISIDLYSKKQDVMFRCKLLEKPKGK